MSTPPPPPPPIYGMHAGTASRCFSQLRDLLRALENESKLETVVLVPSTSAAHRMRTPLMAAADTGDLALFSTVAHAVDWSIRRQPQVGSRQPTRLSHGRCWRNGGGNPKATRRNPPTPLRVEFGWYGSPASQKKSVDMDTPPPLVAFGWHGSSIASRRSHSETAHVAPCLTATRLATPALPHPAC